MSKDIRIKKGLDIRLVGEAEKKNSEGPRSRTITIKPSEFHLVTPKMVVKEGAKLQAGDELFYSKSKVIYIKKANHLLLQSIALVY